MNSIIKSKETLLSILDKRILLCDGAMGTMLNNYGYTDTPDILNLESGALKDIASIHLSYLEAGSDIILTNTFGSNRIKLSRTGNENNTEVININALKAARDAIEIYREKNSSSKKIFIAGDVGPTGGLLEPIGDIKFKDAVDSYKIQIETLIENGVDLILIETIIDLNEALAAVRAVREINSEIIVACTLSFKENGVTVMGNKAEKFGSILLDENCDIIGANCSVGSDSMINITGKIRSSNPGARLLIQPNAGLPEMVNGKTEFNETPDIMAKNFKEILKYNPSIIGGCCGSTPAHIKKIADLLHETQ
jgi:5-methyltetrahydrofolate--homocysteine methyltransferase